MHIVGLPGAGSFMGRPFNRFKGPDLWGNPWIISVLSYTYMLGAAPFPVINSDHQDDIAFLVGDPYKPSFATITGKGDNPTYMDIAKKKLCNGTKIRRVSIFPIIVKGDVLYLRFGNFRFNNVSARLDLRSFQYERLTVHQNGSQVALEVSLRNGPGRGDASAISL